jgi:hypothetical protein
VSASKRSLRVDRTWPNLTNMGPSSSSAQRSATAAGGCLIGTALIGNNKNFSHRGCEFCGSSRSSRYRVTIHKILRIRRLPIGLSSCLPADVNSGNAVQNVVVLTFDEPCVLHHLFQCLLIRVHLYRLNQITIA